MSTNGKTHSVSMKDECNNVTFKHAYDYDN